MRRVITTVCLLLLVFAEVIAAAPFATGASAQFTVLHSFSGPDGGSPTGLIQTADGSFYGAAVLGGDVNTCAPDGCGTLYKIDSAGQFTALHVFHASDGYHPTGLVKGRDGNFYGTTMSGGQPLGGGSGTIFRLDPTGNFTVLYAFVGGFACCDGAGPWDMVQASDGNFYGTTGAGGAFRDIENQGGFGTVFRFDPISGAVTILHSFKIQDGNGIHPNGPLIQASDGLLYGTTFNTVFKIDTAGNLTMLYAFADNLSVGAETGLIQASDGFFYGTTVGAVGAGTVYRVDANGNYALINQFDGADGYKARCRLLQAADGFLYGTAPGGGLLDAQGGDIFRLDTSGTLGVLHSLTITGPDGFSPNSQLVQGVDGALYGVTGIGGSGGHGTVFRFDQRVPGTVASITVSPAVIHSGQTSTGTVTLSSPAPKKGTIVNLGSGSFQITLPSSVTVKARAVTAKFTIQALNVGAAETVRIYATFAGQGVRTTLTVLP